MDNTKSILLKILDAIGYTDDKEKFAIEFIETIKLQSLSNLIKLLPVDKQLEAQQKLTENSNNPEIFANILNNYFNQSEMEQSLHKTAKDMFSDYLQSINDSLSVEQKQNLAKALKALPQNAPQPA